MLDRPQFKPHFHVEAVPPDVVYLLSEKEQFALSGRLYALLAPLLDGSRAPEDLVRELRGEAAAPEVYYALMQLERRGYLVEAEGDGLDPEAAAFWHMLGVDASLARARLSGTRVEVTALGDIPVEPLLEALAALGVPAGDEGGFQVVLAGDYLDPELEAINRRGRPIVCETIVLPLISAIAGDGGGPRGAIVMMEDRPRDGE